LGSQYTALGLREGRIAYGGGGIIGPECLACEQGHQLGGAGLDGVLEHHVAVRIDETQGCAGPLPSGRLGNLTHPQALALPPPSAGVVWPATRKPLSILWCKTWPVASR